MSEGELEGAQGAPLTQPLAETRVPDAVAAAPGFARFTRGSAVFALGSVVGKVIGLLLLPILTRSLTPAGFGSMDVLISLASAIGAPLVLGLDVATLRLYFDQPDRRARGRLIGTSYGIAIAAALVAAAVIALGSGAISTILFGSSDLQPAVVAIGVAIVGGAAQLIALTVLRAQGRAGWYAAVSSGSVVVYAILAVALLTFWRADANAVVVAYAAALAVSGLAGMFLVRAEAIGRPAAAAARTLLRLGLPLTPAVIATNGAEFLNRTILLSAAGAADVAYFTVALRFASVAGIVVTGFQLAWPPRAYALGTSEAARTRLAADARWVVALACGAVIALAVASPEIVAIAAGTRYAAALPALGFCLVAQLLEALYLVASLPSAVARATRDLAVATVGSVAVALVGNSVLAPIWNSTGTAAAVVAGQLVGILIVGRLGMRRLPLPVDWVRLGVLVTVTGTVAVVLLVSNASLPVRLLAGTFTLALIAWSVPLREALVPVRARLRR